jgi:tetratricopeptide (TPR) repeat protein
MAPSVRQQIGAQRETLAEVLKNASVSDRDLAREFGLMGQLLMAAESAAAAKPFLARAIQLDPAEPRWPYYLGHLHRMLGDAELAAQSFDRAVTLRPDDVPALVWLANVYLAQGQHGLATPLYERALARQPGVFAALFGLGRAASIRGDYAKAAGYFEAALRRQPNASAVRYPLAVAYRQLGRAAEAEVQLRARGEYDPGPPDPLMEELAGLLRSSVVFERQGDRALTRGDNAAAVSSFRRGLELAPDRAALRQKLATALALTGDVASAVELYQQLLRENPSYAEAHYSLGALFLGRGRPDLALPRFAAAVKADPTYVHARLQLAHTLRRVGRLEAALVEYQGALAVEPRMAEARLGYAVTLADLGRWGAARAWLIEGRRAHPDRPEFSESLARLLAAAPDANVRDGPAALELARELVTQSRAWNTLEALAMALAETGSFDEAIGRQREALDAYQRVAGEPSAAMVANLRRYEGSRPSRVPWSSDPIR